MANLQNLNETGTALQGYDPVSYFSGRPVKGSSDISITYEGATYYFNNKANKDAFEAAPQQYVPQYGGFCAVAVSEGKTFPIDPNTYKVADGKLYLFYNGKLGNTKPQWEADAQTRKANADAHWQENDLTVVYPTVDY
ncbi:MAG: YHS domain-containing protein [Cyanothece sp. SIO1E1]|nr:YHS domain-containing protein [Cyanothece sp. SIO1E1]